MILAAVRLNVTKLRIPTARMPAISLSTHVAKELNSRLPRTNASSG